MADSLLEKSERYKSETLFKRLPFRAYHILVLCQCACEFLNSSGTAQTGSTLEAAKKKPRKSGGGASSAGASASSAAGSAAAPPAGPLTSADLLARVRAMAAVGAAEAADGIGEDGEQ